MKRLMLFFILLLLSSCSTIKYVPVESKIDSVYIEKIVERVDTIYIDIPVEVREVITYADSSHLETSVAVSDVWVDSLYVLHHKLQNKSNQTLKKEVNHKDKIIEKKVLKEVPVIQEVKVPVEVIPRYYQRINAGFWILLSILILIVGFKIFKIVRKFII